MTDGQRYVITETAKTLSWTAATSNDSSCPISYEIKTHRLQGAVGSSIDSTQTYAVGTTHDFITAVDLTGSPLTITIYADKSKNSAILGGNMGASTRNYTLAIKTYIDT